MQGPVAAAVVEKSELCEREKGISRESVCVRKLLQYRLLGVNLNNLININNDVMWAGLKYCSMAKK